MSNPRRHRSCFAVPVIGSVLLVLAVLGACNKDDERDPCLQPRNVALRFSTAYRRADTGAAVNDTLLNNPLLIPVGGQVILDFDRTQRFSAFLSPEADQCVYVLRPDSADASIQDTLTFTYTRKLQFLSNACGYTYFFNLSQVQTSHVAIDSVRILDPGITNNANVEHLKVYYRR